MRNVSMWFLLTLLLAVPDLAVGDVHRFSRGSQSAHEHQPTASGNASRAAVGRRAVAPEPEGAPPASPRAVRPDRRRRDAPLVRAAEPAGPPARKVPLRR